MSINNTIELTGNMNNKGVHVIETEKSKFAVLSLATTDSYKNNETNKYINKETIWHDLIVFSPNVIKILTGLNLKARIKVTGSLNYQSFPVEIEVEDNGVKSTKLINKKEASIIIRKVELAPLTKKS